MNDPYQILGVSPSDSEQDIAQAYRKLAKKYHPDLNPGNQEAEKKMQEINAAYDQIKNGTAGAGQAGQQGGGYSGNPYGDSSYGGGAQSGGQQQNPYAGTPFEDLFDEMFSGRGYQQQSGGYGQSTSHTPSPAMRNVNNLVASGRYQQAAQELSRMNERTAEWYFYSALVNMGAGNRASALNYAREAVRRDPDNQAYNELLDQLGMGGFAYQQAGQSHGFDMTNAYSTMLRMCLANMCCMMFCRPC